MSTIDSTARRLVRALGLAPAARSVASTRLVDTSQLHALPEQRHLSRLLPLLGVDCVFDVGANTGQYARMLRRRAGYRGRIVSFEPIPELAAQVRERADRDRDREWSVEEVALADTEAAARPFNVMSDPEFSSFSTPSTSDVSIYRDQNVAVRQISVRTESLASAFRRLKAELGFSRPFLKLDTQGLDVEVIRSGRDVVTEFVGLQSELAVKRLYEDSVDFGRAIACYQEFGFELSALVPNNGGCFPRLVEIDCIMVRHDLLDAA